MLLSKSAACNNKKSKFIKKQKAKRLSSNLTGVKISILNDSLLANILF